MRLVYFRQCGSMEDESAALISVAVDNRESRVVVMLMLSGLRHRILLRKSLLHFNGVFNVPYGIIF